MLAPGAGAAADIAEQKHAPGRIRDRREDIERHVLLRVHEGDDRSRGELGGRIGGSTVIRAVAVASLVPSVTV